MKKRVILGVGLVFISILGIVFILSSIHIDQVIDNNEDEFTDNAIIYINDQIPKYSWKTVNSTYYWCTGSGTQEDPYVIRDIILNGNGYGVNGIVIWNSSAYFILYNCNITLCRYHGCGIRLINVNNGVVKENILEDNDYGIFAYNCFNVNITMNDILKNHYQGIMVTGSPEKECSDVYIYQNRIENNGWTGIDLWDCRNICITKNRIRDCGEGINMNRANENLITDCIIKSCGENGIRLLVSDYNFVSNNTFYENGEYGLRISQSDRNKFLNNTISNNSYDGVYLAYSDYNQFINNSIKYGGVSLLIGYDNTYKSNTFISNTINNKPLYYYKESGLNPADFSNAGQIILIGSSNTVISGVNLTHTGRGILLVDCQNIFIRNVSVSWNLQNGIEIQRSENIEVNNNSIFNNKKIGIYCRDSSYLNILNNSLSKNDWGIWIWQSNNAQVDNNYIANSITTGIYSDNSINNTIKSNTILNCLRGIQSSNSTKNNISKNFLLNNTFGTYLLYGSDHILNKNMIKNNTYGMYFSVGNNHIIGNNSISGNQFGIYMKYTNYTIIKCNNFTSNQNHIEQINCFEIILEENIFHNVSLSLLKDSIKVSDRTISSIINILKIISLSSNSMI